MTKTITKRRGLTVFRTLASTVILLLLLGTNALKAQTYFTEGFEGTWYLNGNAATAATAAGPNAPSTWTQTRVLNNVVPGACAGAAHDWGQALWGASYTSVNFAGTSTSGCAPYGGSPGVPPAGSNVLWFYDGNTQSGSTRRIESPVINLSTATSPIISFSFSYAQSSTACTFVGSNDGGATWNTISALTTTTAGAWATRLIAIPAAYNVANAKFGFQIASTYGSYDVFIDNLVIREGVAPTAAPISLTTTAVTTTNITLGWTDNSTNETGFRVFRSTDNINFTQIGADITSTTVAATGGTYSSAQTALSPGTTYYFKVASYVEVNALSTVASQATVAGTTYYWVGTSGAAFGTAANWNTDPAGTGTARTAVATTDVLIVDGAGTTPGGTLTISEDLASFSIGQFKVTSNTTLTLVSSAATTRAITITGGGGNDFVIESGSALTINSATNAVSFAFSGTGNTGDISGTYNLGGSTANTFSSTGGTSTLVTISSTGIVNNGIVGTGSYFTGSAATMSFAAGSAYNVTGATTGATVPLATWATTSTLTITSITTATAVTNNSQSFGNLTYNCASSNGTMSFFTTSATAVVKGNLTITASGSGKFRALTSGNISINGNLNVNGGYFEVASSTGILNVLGNVNIAGGTFDLAQASSPSLKVTGNFIQTAGTIAQTSTTGTLEFNGTSASTLTLVTGSHGANAINLKVNNAAGVNLTSAFSAKNITITKGNISGAGSISYNGTSSLLTYNGTVGAQTANTLELPATGGPSSLTINNTATSPANVVNIPYSATLNGTAGVLTLTAGNLDNTGYVLTLSNTATTAISGGSATAYVIGAIARSIPASYATASTYTFPVGKGTYNPFELVNPTTNSGGAVTVQAEVVDANAGGTAGTLMGTLKTNRYWAASITSGGANFTGSLIKLNDAPAGADAIAASSTLTGAYDIVGGVTITSTASSLTSTAPAATNIVGYYVMGNKAAATLSALAITPTGNLCTNALRTVTVTATPGGGAVTGVVINYTLNGAVQTPITMTNTTGDNWTGDIPTVTPTNATVAWSVTATDVNLLTKSATGTAYADEPLYGVTANVSSTVSTICAGSTATLTTSLVRGSGGIAVGAGASTSSATAQSFFPGGWGGAKTQFIIRAAELTAVGLSAGNITKIGYVPTVVGQTYQGFQMLVGQTAQTTMTTTYLPNASLTKVFEGSLTNSGILPVANVVNDLSFGTGSGSASSFAWDGVSNLVISISWSLNPTAYSSTATTMQVDNPGYVCSAYNQADAQTMAAMAAYTTGTTGSTRPKFVFTAAPAITSVTWNDGSSNFSTSNPVTVAATSTTTYTATVVAAGCTVASAPLTLNVATPPTVPTVNSTVSCPGVPTVSLASTSGIGTTKFKWYSALTGGTVKQNSVSTTYTTSITQTDTSYVTEIDTVSGCESSPRSQIIAKVNALTIAAVTPWFCGQGAQTDDLTATSSDIAFTSYTWSTVSAGASLNSASGNPVTANLTTTSAFSLTATDGTCSQDANITIGMYDFPTPNFTVSPNDTVCLGSPITIGTGLAAGAFSSSTIAYAPASTPVSTTILANGGAAVVALTSGSLDDGGWGGIPIGFTFNFFGTPYTTLNVGTNGAMMFGTYNSTGIADYTYTTLPSLTEPFNTVAMCANDNNFSSGKLHYWTEGTAPNRRFIVEYLNVAQYGNAANTTNAQAIFYETTGVIEEHVFNSGSTNNKVCGINNGNGTIGALAYASTAVITTPIAYRFTPPSNYSTVWSPAGSLSGTTTGTNIFQVTTNIPSVGTTSVSLVLTNLTTGCTNALSPSTVDVYTIDKPIAPITSGNTVCGQGSALLTVTNAGSMNPTDTIKWYTDSIGGSPIAWGDTYTTPTVLVNTTYYTETYNGFCVNNSGRVPVTLTVTVPDAIVASSNYSAPVCLGASANITVNQALTNNSYSLTWTASNYTTSGLTGPTVTSLGTPISVTPTATGTYYLTITGTESGTGCVISTHDTLRVIAPFAAGKHAIAAPSTICVGSSALLTATYSGSSNTLSTVPTFTGGNGSGGITFNIANTSSLPVSIDSLAAIFSGSQNFDIWYNTAPINGSPGTIGVASGWVLAGSTTGVTGNGVTPQVLPIGVNVTIPVASSYGFAIIASGSLTYTTFVSGTMPQTVSDSKISIEVGLNVGYGGGITPVNYPRAFTGSVVYSDASGASFSWSDGSTVVGTTNPLSVSPTTNTTYTVTMSTSGCSDTAIVSVNTLSVPSDPSVTSSAHCGNQIPTCSASGGASGDYRWYTDLIGGIAFPGEYNGTLSSYHVGATTTLYVSITNGTCESNRIPVTVTVTTPDPVIAAASQTSGVCANTQINLSVSQALTNNMYALTWSANTPTGSGMASSVGGYLGTNLPITPTVAGTYTYTISGVESSTGCVISSDVFVSVIDPFNGVNTSSGATLTTVCAGSPTSLSAYAFTSNPAVYTAPPAVTYPTSDEDMANITITQSGTTILNNTTANNSLVGSVGTASGTVGSYSDFTSFGPYAVNAGQTYDFSISSSTSGTAYSNAFGIYIDYNRNGVFTDAGEAVHISSATVSGAHTETGTFTIPALASNGQTRMRIISNEGLVTAPDMTIYYGEYEEYILDVVSSNLSGGNVPTLSYSWSDGTSIIGTNNPMSVSPTIGTTYTPTLISSGCILLSTPTSISVNPVAIAPSAPTTVSKTSGSIDVSWNSTSGATGYRLDVSTNAGFSTFVSGYNDLSVAGTSQSITGLSSGVTYHIRVRAENGCGASANSSSLTDSTVSSVSIGVTAFLQGLYLGGSSMTAAPFNADGVSSSNVADTITVELHDAFTFATTFSSSGNLSTSGLANVTFSGNAIGGSYYVVILHRNSITTWSANPVTILASGTVYDFSTGASQAAGSNMADDGSGVFLIYTGDINQDGAVDFGDYPNLDIASSNGVIGYDTSDLDGNGAVDFADYPVIDINSSNGVLSSTP